MTGDQPAAIGQPGFVRGHERLDQLLADPRLAADVAAAHADAEEMDRVLCPRCQGAGIVVIVHQIEID